LSQDDFSRLQKDIHVHMEKHISKVNGKIEEIAASEEDEDAGTLDMQGASHDKEDDEEVILTSARLY